MAWKLETKQITLQKCRHWTLSDKSHEPSRVTPGPLDYTPDNQWPQTQVTPLYHVSPRYSTYPNTTLLVYYPSRLHNDTSTIIVIWNYLNKFSKLTLLTIYHIMNLLPSTYHIIILIIMTNIASGAYQLINNIKISCF